MASFVRSSRSETEKVKISEMSLNGESMSFAIAQIIGSKKFYTQEIFEKNILPNGKQFLRKKITPNYSLIQLSLNLTKLRPLVIPYHSSEIPKRASLGRTCSCGLFITKIFANYRCDSCPVQIANCLRSVMILFSQFTTHKNTIISERRDGTLHFANIHLAN